MICNGLRNWKRDFLVTLVEVHYRVIRWRYVRNNAAQRFDEINYTDVNEEGKEDDTKWARRNEANSLVEQIVGRR